MYTTSISLLQKLRERGADTAWGRFVELYSPLLFFWAKRIGLPDHDAADLVQEVFAVLLVRLPEFQYDRDKSFRSWLRMVSMNLWRSQVRRKRVVAVGESEQVLDELTGDAVAADEVFWEREYQQHIVRQAMRVMDADAVRIGSCKSCRRMIPSCSMRPKIPNCVVWCG